MQQLKPVDVVIAGGGFVGLTLAKEISTRTSLSVVVLERGHARKLAARMLEQGHEVLYFENIEGGHAAGADNAQAARMWAQTLSFLARQLGLPAAK